MNLEGSSLADVFGASSPEEGSVSTPASDSGSGGGMDPRPHPLQEEQGDKQFVDYMPRETMMSCNLRGEATTMQMAEDKHIGPSEGSSVHLQDMVHNQRHESGVWDGTIGGVVNSRMAQPAQRQTSPEPTTLSVPSGAQSDQQQAITPAPHQQQPEPCTMDQVMEWVREALAQGEGVLVHHRKGRTAFRGFAVAGQPQPVISVANDGYKLNAQLYMDDHTGLLYHLMLAVAPMVHLQGVQIGERTFVPGQTILPPNNEHELTQAALEATALTKPEKQSSSSLLSNPAALMHNKWVWIGVAVSAALLVAVVLYMRSRKKGTAVPQAYPAPSPYIPQ
jgi:hypothetical protein